MSSIKNCIETVNTFEYNAWKLRDKQDIIANSVINLTNTTDTVDYGLYDSRMGPSKRSDPLCLTCKDQFGICTGHTGHIELNSPMPHGSNDVINELVKILNLCCVECAQPKVLNTNKDRLKIKACNNCIESYVDVVFRSKRKNKSKDKSNMNMFVIKRTNTNGDSTTPLSNDHIIGLLQKIEDTPEWYKILPFNGNPPRSYMIEALCVIPPVTRPVTIGFPNKRVPSDITLTYKSIIQTDQEMRSRSKNKDPIELYNKQYMLIQRLFNNPNKETRANVGIPYNSIDSILTGKEGHIREFMMAKRGVNAGRAVIDGSADQIFDEVLIPDIWQHTLIDEEIVCDVNIERLSLLLANHQVKTITRAGRYPINVSYNIQSIIIDSEERRSQGLSPVLEPVRVGDKIVRPADDVTDDFAEPTLIDITRENIENIELVLGDRIQRTVDGRTNSYDFKAKEKHKLMIGDVIEYCLQDGALAAFLRYPELHEASITVFRIRFHKGRNMYIPFAWTGAWNADFDGDQMNCLVLRTIGAKVEGIFVSSARGMFISPQDSKPNAQVIQETAYGIYFASTYDGEITEEQFLRITRKISDRNLDRIEGKLTGKSMISLLLPDDYHLSKTIKNPYTRENVQITITNGIITSGYIDKGIINGNFIPQIYHEHGYERVSRFITELQYLALEFLEFFGYTVSLRDCYSSFTDTMHKNYRDSYIKAIKYNHLEPEVRFKRMTATIDEATQENNTLVLNEFMNSNNGIMNAILSGGKGTVKNHMDIVVCAGLQTINRRPINPTLPGKRTFTCFNKIATKNPLSSVALQMGFVENSFSEGLTPQQHQLASPNGRGAINSRSQLTKKSGYDNAQTSKSVEDAVIQHDGTIRHVSSMRIYKLQSNEFDYDLDECSQISNYFVKGEMRKRFFCLNIKREVARINGLESSARRRLLTDKEIQHIADVIPINKTKMIRIGIKIRNNIQSTIISELSGVEMYPDHIDILRRKIYNSHVKATYRVYHSAGLSASQNTYAPVTQGGMNQHQIVGGTIIPMTEAERLDEILKFSSVSTAKRTTKRNYSCVMNLKISVNSIKAVRDVIGHQISYLEMSKLILDMTKTNNSVVIVLDKANIYKYRVTLGIIRRRIYEAFDVDTTLQIENASMKSEVMTIYTDYVHNLYEKLPGLHISGLSGITRYEIAPTKVPYTYKILTEGSNMKGLMLMYPDAKVSTNNPYEILSMYGMIGLERWMKRQAYGIMCKDSKDLTTSNVHYDHIDVIISTLTSNGYQRPITRNGLAVDQDASPMKLISFEEPFKNIQKAAIRGRKSTASHDISGAVMNSAKMPIGPDAVRLYRKI